MMILKYINIILYLILFTNCYSQSNRQFFKSEKEANNVLTYYDSILLRSEKVIHVAVVKKKNFGFYIEVGILNENDISLQHVSPDCVCKKKFKSSVIPQTLILPKWCKKYKEKFNDKSFLVHKREFLNKKSIVVKKTFLTNDSNNKIQSHQEIEYKNNEFRFYKDFNSEENWLNFPIGSKPIFGSELGTIGGIFRLKEYPDKLFGITNSHVIGSTLRLGDKVYKSSDKKDILGYVFWKSKKNRDAAIIEFNYTTKKLLEEILPKEGISLSKPKIATTIFKKGITTYPNETNAIIHSINASVKTAILEEGNCHQDDYLGREKRCILRNQILMKTLDYFANGGDSGTSIYSKKNNRVKQYAMGLYLGETNTAFILGNRGRFSTYYLANRLDSILNFDFEINQEIYDSLSNTIIKGPKTFNLYKNYFFN